MDLKELSTENQRVKTRSPARIRLRNYFLTGLVVAAPISITVYLTWTFVHWVDSWVKPLIPRSYNPDSYLPFSVPGVGLVFAIFLLTLLGFLTANIVGRSIVSYGEMLLARMPLVRNLYSGLKQIFQTALSESNRSFNSAGLIEYPRTGLWAIVFIATEAKGEVRTRLEDMDDEIVSVFLPTTPNPTSGFLLFVPRSAIRVLDMTVEEAAKLVISAGLVNPEYQAKTRKLAEQHAPPSEPPSVAAE
ncbi:MAG TPA: DUF502 domain-containing protein [Afifellaceae bacterium]|nr:DUF502 domain-containing protein [Afifellaceae bacterium]